MATKGLGNETLVTSILRSNTVLVEVGGSVRRITVENFMNAINNGDEQNVEAGGLGDSNQTINPK